MTGGFDDDAGPEDCDALSDAEQGSLEAQDARNEGDE